MNTIWERLERDMSEQLAGIALPIDPRAPDDKALERLREASPVRPYPPIGSQEL